ncbi:hypothetical protein B0H13DRAFT_2578120 [Mycena leptocephala]|nr:hypothetical protein B0H13DRAFT_2578120 [Mycena leptocephala]
MYYFRQLAQPLLFQHQSFTAPDPHLVDQGKWMDTVRYIQKSITRFKKLTESDHILSVRSWEFRGSFEFPSMAWSCPGLPDVRLAEEAYGSMNLRFLSLRSLTIDTPLRAALRNLVQLKGLVLYSCDVSSWTEAVLVLDEFTLVSTETLRALHIDGRLYSSALLSGFAEDSKTFSNLVSLTVELWEAFVPQLLAFLECCPQLTHLEISKSGLTRAPTGHLAPAIIPLLRSFKGRRVLGVFVGFQRPIEVIELSGGSGVKSPKKEDVIGALLPRRALALADRDHWPELRELSMELKRLRQSGIPGFDDSDDDSGDDTESGSDDMMGGPIIGMWGEYDSSGWSSGEELELERGLYEGNIDPADLERQLLEPASSTSATTGVCTHLSLVHGLTNSSFSGVWIRLSAQNHTLCTGAGRSNLITRAFPSQFPPASRYLTLPQTLIGHLAAGRLSLPSALTSLRLLRSTLLAIVSHHPPIALDQQHRAIQHQLPALREIGFETSYSRATRLIERRVWRREVEGGTWCLNLSEGVTKIASLVGRES